jgi:hypothetical protein
MEARLLRAALLVAAVIFSCGAGRPYYSVRSQHFIVSAPTPQLAEEICKSAEQYRRDLAIEWLGHELPDWQMPCPIRADVSPGLGAGGATSFVFRNNAPGEWTMKIQGSRERVLDSVLPHEVTHTIFATHFGRPLPRWADEGACTTVEHDSEKAKQDKFLIEFLTSDPPRGIAFNRMFQMKEYPPDILPLYSQGYSLARFFIEQGGKRKFVEYVGEGMRTNNWTAATRKFYDFNSLSDLQLTWVEWVRRGSPALPDGTLPEFLLVSSRPAAATNAVASRNMANTQMASLTQQPRSRIPDGALASWQTIQSQNARTFAEADQIQMPQPANSARPAVMGAFATPPDYSSVSRPVSEGWYAKRRDQAQATRQSVSDMPAERVVAPAVCQSAPDRSDGGGQADAERIPPPPTRRSGVEARPLSPVAADAPPGAGGVIMEWTRPADQPFRPREDLIDVAANDRATLLR